jgi:hypothetical protein
MESGVDCPRMNDTPSNAEMPVPVAPAKSHHLFGEELVQAHALARTKSAVRVRFGAPPYQHEVWVWAGAVRVLTGDTADQLPNEVR